MRLTPSVRVVPAFWLSGVFACFGGVNSPPVAGSTGGVPRAPTSSSSNVVLVLTTLATLPGPTLSGLTAGGDGNFYGVTQTGGSSDQGAVFQAAPGGALNILYSFTGGADGGLPAAGLTLGADGSFYGTASGGGNSSLDPTGAGTIFNITTNGAFTLLYSFTGGGDGDTPFAALVPGANGVFYGSTEYGGDDGYGVIFTFAPGGSLTPLYSFDFTATNGSFEFDDGASPAAALVLGTNGNFYGTTQSGGAGTLGTLFTMTPAGTLTTLESFTAADGGSSQGLPGPQLTLGPDGNFYGTTFQGGTDDKGTVFRLASDGTITTLYSFVGGGDGSSPTGGLLVGNDGNLYGTASYGGDVVQDPAGRGYGTVFEITPAGALSSLYSFTGGADGGVPASPVIQGADGGFYGATATTVFRLAFVTPPFFMTQPANQTVAPGVTATLMVSAGGTAPLGYQWQFAGTNLPGASSASLVLTNAGPAQAGYYTVVVSNAGGSTNSAAALLTVTAPPVVTVQPLAQSAAAGASASFSVTVGGAPPLSYQWYFNGAYLPGAVAADLNLTNITLAQIGNYSVVARDAYGSVTSSIAALTVSDSPPVITGQPAGQIAGPGQSASFTVTAVGTPPLGYQWQFDGTNLPGATGAALTLPGVTTGDAGFYGVVVSNSLGSAASSNAPLTVVLIPQFLTQPAGGTRIVTAPASVVFAAGAAGAAPLSYQWLFNGTDLPGATNLTYIVTNAASTQSGLYTVSASNAYGSATSSPPALLLVEGAYVTTTLAGLASSYGTNDGTGAKARFQEPYDVAVDAAANVYVVDASAGVRKITPNGVVTTLAAEAFITVTNNGVVTKGLRFGFATALAVDAAGNVYVADSGNELIEKVTPAGAVSAIAGGFGKTGSTDGASNVARFFSPMGIALDSARNLYVADTYNRTIRKITPSGMVSTIAGSAGAVGSADGSSNLARFSFPQGLALDSSDNIYVADAGNSTIRKISPSGLVTTIAGRAGAKNVTDGLGTNARFSYPNGLAVDLAGNLYVTDETSGEIRMVTAGGVVTTLAGSIGQLVLSMEGRDGTGALAKFTAPIGVAVDGAGAVYVADSQNANIRKAFPLGTVAGPSFTIQPPSQTVAAGADVTFAPVLSGSTPLSFQWQLNGVNLAPDTAPALSLTNVEAALAGAYTLVVTNLAGSVVSSNALLTLTTSGSEEITQPAWESSVFTLSIATQAGHTYTLEYKDDLTLPAWTLLQVVSGTGAVVTLSDPGATLATRFYRVLIE